MQAASLPHSTVFSSCPRNQRRAHTRPIQESPRARRDQPARARCSAESTRALALAAVTQCRQIRHRTSPLRYQVATPSRAGKQTVVKDAIPKHSASAPPPHSPNAPCHSALSLSLNSPRTRSLCSPRGGERGQASVGERLPSSGTWPGRQSLCARARHRDSPIRLPALLVLCSPSTGPRPLPLPGPQTE